MEKEIERGEIERENEIEREEIEREGIEREKEMKEAHIRFESASNCLDLFRMEEVADDVVHVKFNNHNAQRGRGLRQ